MTIINAHLSYLHGHVSMEISKLRVLGEGTLGTVRLAWVNSQVVVIKSTELSKWPALSKEYNLLKKLDGCNEVTQCFGMFNDFEDGKEYCNLLLEYASGGSLDDHIKNHQGGCLPENENMVRKYILMLLRGLSAIHQKGIVHCDLKPANILVFPNEDGICRLKIADFGNARTVRFRNSRKFKIVGTPLYMSPESVALGEIMPPLDVWSLGCIIIEMLTGKRALQLRSLKDLITYLAFTNEAPSIPENMSTIGRQFLEKCFVRNPKERWTADMLLNHPYMFNFAYPLSFHKIIKSNLSTCASPPCGCSPVSSCCCPDCSSYFSGNILRQAHMPYSFHIPSYDLWSPKINFSRLLESFKD
ncbi:hypothetical protein K2173_001151 [Erythroxylum novogranatense]|uniref:Protein kinase domain-containing protein n=1 Tax=Erythroxylum novogranatense TaxID=1862640 RepID=A0AAV8TI96_9ROSI|nr:hypothetical protein K2173_001151 [Erythroxylum novogranatense]